MDAVPTTPTALRPAGAPTGPRPRRPESGLHAPLARRRSTRAFDPAPVPVADVALVFEAARWAPSAMNRQSWRFVVGRRDDAGPDLTHAALTEALAPGNRTWADRASLLVAAFAPTHVSGPDEGPDLTAAYELGLAVAHLETQAHALGLVTHQMGGFSREAVTTVFDVPDGWTPVVVVAVGRPGDVADLPAELAGREAAPRTRIPLTDLVFSSTWGRPALPDVDVDRAVA